MRVVSVTGPLLLGVATGCRSTLGAAGVSFGGPGDAKVLSAVQSRAGRGVTGTLVLAELVADKMPSAHSRLSSQALVARLVLGAAGGAALGWRDGHNRPVAALSGVVGAVLGSVAGLRYRQAASQRGLPDLGAALVEDVAALVLAAAGGRSRRG